jgi:hypothetical protein
MEGQAYLGVRDALCERLCSSHERISGELRCHQADRHGCSSTIQSTLVRGDTPCDRPYRVGALKPVPGSDLEVDFCARECQEPPLDFLHEVMEQLIVRSAPLLDRSLHAVPRVPIIERLDNLPS